MHDYIKFEKLGWKKVAVSYRDNAVWCTVFEKDMGDADYYDIPSVYIYDDGVIIETDEYKFSSQELFVLAEILK